MTNTGLYPIDYASPVGQVRALLGDVDPEPFDPPAPGERNYTMFSDQEIEGFLSAGRGSVYRATGFAYMSLAGRAALEAKSIKDYDLAVDTTKRADDLRDVAQMWFDQADAEDSATGEAEWFDIVPTGADHDFVAEGTSPVYGRQYTWGRWR